MKKYNLIFHIHFGIIKRKLIQFSVFIEFDASKFQSILVIKTNSLNVEPSIEIRRKKLFSRVFFLSLCAYLTFMSKTYLIRIWTLKAQSAFKLLVLFAHPIGNVKKMWSPPRYSLTKQFPLCVWTINRVHAEGAGAVTAALWSVAMSGSNCSSVLARASAMPQGR